MAAAPRTRTGCTSCRVRHLKCDETRPVCKRCQRAGRECVRGYNVRFRYGTGIAARGGVGGSGGREGGVLGNGSRAEYWFGEEQVWVETKGRLNFIDETPSLTASIWDSSPSPEPEPLADVDDSPAPDPDPASSPRTVRDTPLLSPPLLSPPQLSPPQLSPPQLSPPLLSPSPQLGLPPQLGRIPAISQTSNISSSPFSSGTSTHSSHNSYPLSPKNLFGDPEEFKDPGGLDVSLSRVVGGVEGVGGGVCPIGDILSHEDELSAGYIEDVRDVVELESGGVDGISISLERPRNLYALKSAKEAALLRHYVENLGSWFDVSDPLKHFTTLVPQHALTSSSPMLLNALLALSARQLSRTSGYDPHAANHYHQECLKHYIPLLSSASSLLDEKLMAATVILRLFEEISAPTTGSDPANHLLGTSIFVNATSSTPISGGLREAAFWVYLRQDIYMSFLHQRTIRTNLENCRVDRSFSPADDCTWANRIIRICGEILIFAFSGGDRAKWGELKVAVDRWRRERPASFNPVWCELVGGVGDMGGEDGSWRGWTGEWYLGGPQVFGAQYWHLARLLLAVYNPSLPRMGPGLKLAEKEIEVEVLHNVRALCGISCVNNIPVACFTACHAIYVCGGWFKEPRERERLLEFLEFTDTQYAWPTEATRKSLKEVWGW